MDYLNVIFRTAFFYIFVVIIFRIMGKREIAQLSVQDLVISIMMAELASISIENIDESIFLTIIPIIILLIFEVVFAYISIKSNKFRTLIEGKPVLIIDKGIINFNEMIRQRYTLDDLLLELRRNNIKNVSDVEYAVLENDGTLSIFKYNFLKIKSTNPFPLILDGIIQKDTLKYLKKDTSWLENTLKKKNINLKEVFYAFYKNNDIFIIKQNEIK